MAFGQLEGKLRWLLGGRMVWKCIAAGCSLTHKDGASLFLLPKDSARTRDKLGGRGGEH